MISSIRILIAGEPDSVVNTITTELDRAGFDYSLRFAQTSQEYADQLTVFRPELILSGNNPEGFSCMEAILLRDTIIPQSPLILVSDTIPEELAIECIRAGAYDSISKYNRQRFGEVIHNALNTNHSLDPVGDYHFMQLVGEARYQALFENSAVPIFEEDFSLIKQMFDRLKSEGVQDFRSHFDAHPEDIVKIASLIRITDVNSEGLRFFQASGKQEILSDIMAGFLDESWIYFKEEIIALAEGKTFFETEFPLSTLAWEHKHVILKLSVRSDSIDTLKHVLVSFIDITERKQIEADLTESEELYRTASESTLIGVCMLDTEGNFTSVNNAAAQLWGFTREELISRSLLDLLITDDRPLFSEQLVKMLRGELSNITTEQRTIAGNGSVIWTFISIGLLHSSNRRKDYFVLYVLDLTQRKEAELNVRKSAELYCTLTENMRDVIWILDPDTKKMTYISPSVEKMTGFKPEEILAIPFDVLFESSYGSKLLDDITKIISDCRIGLEKPGTYHTQIIRQPRKDGSSFWAEVSVYAYFNEESGKLELRGAHRDITEKQEAEERIRKSEEKFRLLFENAADPIQLLDENMKFIDCNEATVKILGATSKDQVIGNNPSAISPENQPDGSLSALRALEHVHHAYLNGNSQFEWVHKRFDGDLMTVDIKLTRINMEGDNLLLVHWRDITDRKAIETALQKSEEKFRLLAENVSDVIFTMDINGKNTYISPSVKRMRGYSPEEALQQSSMESIALTSYPIAHEFLSTSIEKIRKGEKFGSYNLILEQNCKDGSTVWVDTTLSGIYDADGEFVSFLGVSRDITDKKKAEEQLKDKQFWLSESQRVGKIGSYIYDISLDSWSSSEVLDMIFGIGKDKQKNMESWIDIIHPDERVEMRNYLVEEVVIKGQAFRKEYRIRRLDDGEDRWVLGLGELLFDHSGKPAKMIGTIQDITDQKNAESALIAAKERAEENDRLKTAFLNNISHEIRTPMNAIIGFSGFLNEPNLQEEKRRYFTEIICNASNQLLSIITDIINISTIEAGQEKIKSNRFNINQVIRNLYNQFQIKAGSQHIELFCTIPLPDHETFVESDEIKLIQVLSNLVNNAIKFTRQGYVSFGYTLQDNHIEFFVEDTGIGIAENLHTEIFERFRQADSTVARQFGGTGLGLSISKAYVELLGGSIWLKSKPGTGSTFFFSLPLQLERNTPSKPMAEIKTDFINIRHTKTILVAEDEDFNYLLFEQLLADLDINLIRAVNGVEAVEICKSNPEIDLVLMDVKMPVMDGYEATKLIKSIHPELPVIMQTAYARESDKIKAISIGCDAYISKPIDIDEFLKLLNKFLNFSTVRQVN